MSETSNQELLQMKIIEASVADTWEEAKLEWSLITIYDADGTCECGHRIVQHCVICNMNNSSQMVVGNVCINHFGVERLHVPPNARAALKRIHESVSTAHANEELLEVARRLSILSEKEELAYTSVTTGSGSRTKFQDGHGNYDTSAVDIVEKVNHLIVMGFRSDRPRCDCGEFAKPRQNGKKRTYFYSCARFPHGCKWSFNI